MSPAAVPAGLTLPGYLDQDKVWIDGRSGTVFQIETLDPRRRGYAARELARQATAFISQMETWELLHDGGLVRAVQLIAANPRVWITQTSLYRALSVESNPGAGREGVVIAVDPPSLPRTVMDGLRREVARDIAAAPLRRAS